MKNKITIILATLAIILSIFKILYYPEKIKSQNISTYNAGYRAGKMDVLAELVECEGVTDVKVLAKYESVSQLLLRMGELDLTAYPCGK